MSEIRLQTLKFNGLPDIYTIPSPVIAEDENSDGNVVIRKYNAVEDTVSIDKTLTIEGAAADAKAVGDRIKNLTTSGDAPVLDAVLGADGIMTYNNSPAFDEWLTETEGGEKFAPSGYVTEVIDIASEAELDTALTNIVTNMPDLTERHVVFQDNAGIFNGGFTLARIFTRVGTHATATFETYGYYGYTKWMKNRFSGTWYPLEWENPPMVLGVEYRTTERYNGKVVYAKAITISGIGVGKTRYNNLASPVTNLVYSEFNAYVSGKSVIYRNDAFGYQVDNMGTTQALSIETNTQLSGVTGVLTVKYTKD